MAGRHLKLDGGSHLSILVVPSNFRSVGEFTGGGDALARIPSFRGVRSLVGTHNISTRSPAPTALLRSVAILAQAIVAFFLVRTSASEMLLCPSVLTAQQQAAKLR